MKFGYIRVSTKEQNESRQIEEFKKLNIDDKNIFIDKASGKNFNRENYNKLKFLLRENDELYLHELDRLGRDKRAMKDELEWFKNNKIVLRILDVPTTLMDFSHFGELQSSILDMVNTVLIEVLSTFAEAEFTRNKKRQREGIDLAKKEGKYSKCGRPKKEVPKNFSIFYEQYLEKKLTINDLQKLLGYKNRKNVYDIINKYKNNL